MDVALVPMSHHGQHRDAQRLQKEYGAYKKSMALVKQKRMFISFSLEQISGLTILLYRILSRRLVRVYITEFMLL